MADDHDSAMDQGSEGLNTNDMFKKAMEILEAQKDAIRYREYPQLARDIYVLFLRFQWGDDNSFEALASQAFDAADAYFAEMTIRTAKGIVNSPGNASNSPGESHASES